MEIALNFLVVIFLVLLNSFFVASEFALVAVRKTRIDELARKGNTAARKVQDASQNLDVLISATQLGITLASLALGWVGEPFLAHIFVEYLAFIPKNIAWFTAQTVSFGLSFFIITFLHIVVGELVPKTIALQRSDTVSLLVIRPLLLFTVFFKPFISLLNGVGNWIVTLMGFDLSHNRQNVHTEEEVKMILAQSGQSGAIPQDEIDMVYNVFKLGDVPISHLMIPRTKILAFKNHEDIQIVKEKVLKSHYSRFPIYDRSIDTIVGYFHIKDLLALINSDKKKKNIEEMVRPALFIPETKNADEVLLDMQKSQSHMAVIKDEYGGTAGIVTLEDIIEALVGEIRDEFDKPEKLVKKIKKNSYLIHGQASLYDLQEHFRFPNLSKKYATIGGMLFGMLGRLPQVGDQIIVGNYNLTVEQCNGPIVKLVRLEHV